MGGARGTTGGWRRACAAGICLGALVLPASGAGASGETAAKPASTSRSLATQAAGEMRPPPPIGRNAARQLAVRTLSRRFYSWRNRRATAIRCGVRVNYRTMRCFAGWVFKRSIFFGRLTVWYTGQDDDFVYFRSLYTIRRYNGPCAVKFGLTRKCQRRIFRGGL